MSEPPVTARITDQGRAYVAWLDSLGDEEPTRTGAFAAGVEWERGKSTALRDGAQALVDALTDHALSRDVEQALQLVEAALEALAQEQGE